jgi:hypothetical protein
MQLIIRHKYIMISPTHRQRRIFMHTISRKDPNKYSNILTSQRLERITENTRSMDEKRCAKNAKISGEIHEKNTQDAMINQ